MQKRYPQIIIFDESKKQWLEFTDALHVFEIYNQEQIIPAFDKIEEYVNREKKYAVGFISYEAAAAFDYALSVKSAGNFPLIYFAIFDLPKIITIPNTIHQINRNVILLPEISIEDYFYDVARIKSLIAEGLTYQVNYTFRMRTDANIEPWDFFIKMAVSRQARYGAFIDMRNFAICSASPELFFKLDGNSINCRPMKGTAGRGKTIEEDIQIKKRLQQSDKDRAENVMIVDMVRNDLSKICEYGSVRTTSLFEIERYPTVWQMVSNVNGKTNAKLSKILKALFPSASITGAPKVKTMSIIRDLEESPRKIYTGSIGLMKPGRKIWFNVAIRTALFDKRNNEMEYGVGGGVVWDSTAQSEYDEALLKAKLILKTYPRRFELLETMLVEKSKKIFLLNYHISRLENSARYFDFFFNRENIYAVLQDFIKKEDNEPYILRLLYDKKGAITLQKKKLMKSNYKRKIKTAKEPIDKDDVFLYHKTTMRRVFDDALKNFSYVDDVLLWNENGEITESTIANIVIKENGIYYTPPINCGLLNGTFRQWLIDQEKIRERKILIEELYQFKEIYLINSVRKWRKVELNDFK